MESEHAVGSVVGDSGARPIKIESLISDDGFIEKIYVDDELVFIADRNPKYKPIPYDDDEGFEDGI